MKYESAGSRGNTGILASYHCGTSGCSVRYNPNEGYYSLSGQTGYTYTVDEPGVNTRRCPTHNQWLYRGARGGDGVRWCCGVQACTYEYGAPYEPIPS